MQHKTCDQQLMKLKTNLLLLLLISSQLVSCSFSNSTSELLTCLRTSDSCEETYAKFWSERINGLYPLEEYGYRAINMSTEPTGGYSSTGIVIVQSETGSWRTWGSLDSCFVFDPAEQKLDLSIKNETQIGQADGSILLTKREIHSGMQSAEWLELTEDLDDWFRVSGTVFFEETDDADLYTYFLRRRAFILDECQRIFQQENAYLVLGIASLRNLRIEEDNSFTAIQDMLQILPGIGVADDSLPVSDSDRLPIALKLERLPPIEPGK